MNVNQIIAYGLYLTIIGVGGYVAKLWKDHNKKLIKFKEKEEKRANDIFGQQTVDRAKKIIRDAVYEFEQLGKENDWKGDLKHTKVLEFVKSELKKLSGDKIILTDEDIFNIIKTTVGYINTK